MRSGYLWSLGIRKKIKLKIVFELLKNYFDLFTGLNDFIPPLFLIALNKSSLGSMFALNLLGFEIVAVFVTRGGGGGGGFGAGGVGIKDP